MYRRPLFQTLAERMAEPRRFIQVIAGPRQVGKTTLIKQLAENLSGFIRFHSADALPAASQGWLEQLWADARAEMTLKNIAEGIVIIDEIQKVENWSEVVKKNWDQDTWDGLQLKIIILGSSRLLLQEGLSESLLGRYELNYLGHWSFSEMHQVFGFSPQQYVWFGGYPGAAPLINDEMRFKSYITNSVIEASLNRDILMLTKVSKPALLRRLFELGTAYSAQILSYNKVMGQLQDAGNTTTLARYLTLLDQSGLLAGLGAYSTRTVVFRSSSPKFQVHNTALSSALRGETFEQAVVDSAWWGRLVESAVGSHLLNQVSQNLGTSLQYWRNRNVEVDYVLTCGDKVLGIEVKSGPSEANPRNLAEFKKTFPQSKTMLIGANGIDYTTFLETSVDELFGALW
jgi:predicted AAA+ superfamily ATPase